MNDDDWERLMQFDSEASPAKSPVDQSLTAYELRDQAMERVESANPDAVRRFMEAALVVASRGRPFTTDDVLAEAPDLENVPEKRSFGPAMKRLAAQGHIRAMEYGSSYRRQSHGRAKRRWITADAIDTPSPV